MPTQGSSEQAHSSPPVSVIIRSMDKPVLARALDSVARQDYPNVRVIVVAASGPSHLDLPSACGRFPLRLVRSGKRLPRAEAANAGLDAVGDASGWITFLDDDDEFLPTQVSTLQSALARQPKYQLAYGQSVLIDAAGQARGTYGGPFQPWKQLYCGFFQFGAMTFSAGLVAAGARFDENLDILEDLEFFVQCAQLTEFLYVPQTLSCYFAAAGDSGTGVIASERDQPRVERALGYIRAKWGGLKEQLDAMPQARLERAQAALQAGDTAGALELLLQLERDLANDVNVLNLAGVALMRDGQPAQALARFQRALQVLPNHAGLQDNVRLASAMLLADHASNDSANPADDPVSN